MVKYCYSLNNEDFFGQHDTPEDAIGASLDDAASEREPGELVTVYVGQVVHPTYYLRKYHVWWTGQLLENLDAQVVDETGADDVVIDLPEDKREGLVDVIVKYLEEHATFHRYGVVEVQEHQVGVPSE